MTFKQDEQEIYAWIGNTIFIIAQLLQVIHTHRMKDTKDISYGLIVFMFIGNVMYTTFGYIDGSLSLFLGSLISCNILLIITCQKIYYENYYYKGVLLGNNVNTGYHSIICEEN